MLEVLSGLLMLVAVGVAAHLASRTPVAAKVMPIGGPTSEWLDRLRVVLALLVLGFHIRTELWLDFSTLDPSVISRSPWVILVYAATSLGQVAAASFFVLSGFLMTRLYLSQLQETAQLSREFAIARLSRLYAVLLPALAVTFALNALRSGQTGFSLPNLLGHLVFLQPFWIRTVPGNAPLWALGYLACAYLIFAALAVLSGLVRSSATRRQAITLGVGTLVVVAFFGPGFWHHFGIWCAGAVAALASIRGLHVPASRSRLALLLGAGLTLGLALLARAELPLLRDWLVTLPLAFTLWVADTSQALPSPRTLWGKRLARYSFTLYASHYPWVLICASWLAGERGHPTLSSGAGLLAVASVAIAGAILLASVTEAQTPAIRAWLSKHLS